MHRFEIVMPLAGRFSAVLVFGCMTRRLVLWAVVGYRLVS